MKNIIPQKNMMYVHSENDNQIFIQSDGLENLRSGLQILWA